MLKVWLEILPGLGEEFTPGNRSRRCWQISVIAGCTLRRMFLDWAEIDEAIGRLIFDVQTQRLYPHVLLTFSGRLMAPDEALDMVLSDGDRVTLFPIYAGG